MPYIQRENRGQMMLMPMCIDDYIEWDNMCRVIAAYVENLDMVALGFRYAKTKNTGRPPHDPASMLMLYLYGYLNRIRSSRRLEAETKRNIEVMWLMTKISPDDKTICNFRKDNTAALKKVFREFSLWCSDQGLYGKELVAVDGTRVRANSSRRNVHTKKGTEKELDLLEKKISNYMNTLEENDVLEAYEAKMSSETISEILKRLSKTKDTLKNWLVQIELNDGKEISTVDPDARFMHQGGDARSLDICYNVQSVVDDKHKLIVDFDVSNCPDDKGALFKMTESAKKIMGIDEISVVADKGYYDGDDVEKCEQNSTTCYISKTRNTVSAPCPDYDRGNFRYDKQTDCYICPKAQKLLFKRLHKRRQGVSDRLYENPKVCKVCENKKLCTSSKHGRILFRSPHQNALDRMNARMLSDYARQIFHERKKLVEHPFGTTKHIWGYRQYLCRGKDKTSAEQALTFFAYNFRRVFNIFKENRVGLMKMLAA